MIDNHVGNLKERQFQTSKRITYGRNLKQDILTTSIYSITNVETIQPTSSGFFTKNDDPCSGANNKSWSSHNNSTHFTDYVGSFLGDVLRERSGVEKIKSMKNAYSISSNANITLKTRLLKT